MQAADQEAQRWLQAQQLLRHLRQQGVCMALQAEQLILKAPPGLLNPELRAEIQSLKPQLLALLQAAERPAPQALGLQEGPLSHSQQRLWFLQQLAPDSTALNLKGACQFQSPLPPEQLEAALQQVTRRQVALRTTFHSRAGVPFQRIHAELPVSLERAPSLSEAAAQAFLERWLDQPFNLEQGPLQRWLWLPLEAGGCLLAWSLHHLISDGWSTGVLLREVLAAFQGQELPLPTLTPLDLACWEARPELQALYETALNFWLEQLCESPLSLELPGETQPKSAGPAETACDLPESLWEALQAFCQREQLTPFIVTLQLWSLLLSRYSGGQSEQVIGVPVSGRQEAACEGLIGCLINTLLLPLSSPEVARFRQICQKLQKRFQAQLIWQDLPFELLIQRLRPPQPLPEACFVFQNNPLPWTSLPGAPHWLDIPQQAPPFPLTLTLDPTRRRLSLSSSLPQLGAELLAQMLRHYLILMKNALQNPDQPLAQIAMLEPEEAHSLWQAGQPQRNPDPTEMLHHRVAHWARSTPNQAALRWQGREYSYADLEARAQGLAEILRQAGVNPGDRVALWEAASPEALLALLAILKRGAAYVPLDSEAPLSRGRNILIQAHPRLLLSQNPGVLENCADLTPGLRLPAWADCPSATDTSEVAADWDLPAYLIYTSGSTGNPQGVVITHRQVTRLFPAVAEVVGLERRDRWVLFHSLAFDYSVWEIWGCFYTGATLLLIPRELARDPWNFWKTLHREQISVLNLTPSALRALLPVLNQPVELPPLRWLILSGEKLETHWLKPWFRRWGDQVAVYNSYGITETTVFVSFSRIFPAQTEIPGASPVGSPLADLGLLLLDQAGRPVPPGVSAEIYITGAGVAQGYFENPSLQAQRFISLAGQRAYRSGDFARRDRDGTLHYLARRDQQIKIRGYRLESGEVEAALLSLPDIEHALVRVVALRPGQPALLAWLKGKPRPAPQLRQALEKLLPAPLIPDHFLFVSAWPLTPNGKLDLKALPLPAAGGSASAFQGSTLARLLELLSELQGGPLDPDLNFLDQGLHSLRLAEAQFRIRESFQVDLELLDLFTYPNPRALASYLESQTVQLAAEPRPAEREGETQEAIAVIAMAGRFPSAPTLEAFWELLCSERTGLTRFSREELRARGVPESRLNNPEYIPVTGVLPDMDLFDREFFGLSAAEARLLDPQQRLLLETGLEVLERGGCGDIREPQACGVFVAGSISRYLLFHLAAQETLQQDWSPMQVLVANDKDYLATRLAYHLNLQGPALSVQTACSSSLVAVHLACTSLLRGECKLALAGGVSLDPNPEGYLYQPGGIYSRDGACRPFSDQASGIVGGSGLGLVLLKPLRRALAEGDPILGVIRGSALSNDGHEKVGFSAPGLPGQVAVLRQALERAGIAAQQIRYLEAHGTGTLLGDAIEIQALSTAWPRVAGQNAWCAVGSVKAVIGHLDAAAGIAGLLKTLLILKHRQIPAQPDFTAPNPRIAWEHSPVYPAQKREVLPASGPLYAAVSSFGIGGTNAHLILESPPEPLQKPTEAGPALLLLSARSAASLLTLQNELQNQLRRSPAPPLQALASTLSAGRRPGHWRSSLVIPESSQLLSRLTVPLRPVQTPVEPKPLIWLCPGLGSQLPGLLRQLAPALPACAEALETALKSLREQAPALTPILEEALLGEPDPGCLQEPQLMQPLIFLSSWILGQTWLSFGLRPAAVMGHSFGEYAALCLAGWISLPEMLSLVLLRGQLFQSLSGFSWAVQGSVEQIQKLLLPGVELVAYNGARQVTIAGPAEQADSQRQVLADASLHWQELAIPHVVHHPLLNPVLKPLTEAALQLNFEVGPYPVISSLTGTLLRLQDLKNPTYWHDHTRLPVQFERAYQNLSAQGEFQALEVGPGGQLRALLRSAGLTAWSSLDSQGQFSAWLETAGQLWSWGHSLKTELLWANQPRQRISLPPTPLERQSYWIEAGPVGIQRQAWQNWFKSLSWQRQALPVAEIDWPAQGLWLNSASTAPVQLPAGWEVLPLPLDRADWQVLQQRAADLHSWVLDLRATPAEQAEAWFWICLTGLQSGLPPGLKQLLCLLPEVHAITGMEQELSPDWGLLQGLLRVLAQERPGLRVCCLESSPEYPLPPTLLAELLQRGPEFLALRGGWAWRPRLEALPLPDHARPLPVGLWLLTGARGELGQTLGRALPPGSTLVLLDDPLLPEAQTLFPQAAGIVQIRGRIEDPQAWEAALRAIKQRDIPFVGCILAAGSNSAQPLEQMERSDCERVLEKWQGTRWLLQALQKQSLCPTQIWVCGALSALKGLPLQGAYTAAHAALGALAESAWHSGWPLKLLHWGLWREGGMAVKALAQLPPQWREAQQRLIAEGISREEAQATLPWIWSLPGPQLVISPLDPDRLAQEMKATPRRPLQTTARPALSEAQQPRPGLETEIARAWSEVLGLAPIGRDESWQSLGGDSLLALQIRERLAKRLQIAVSPALFAGAVTVAGLAEALHQTDSASVLIPLRKQGRLPALFCVHAISGTVFPFQALAQLCSSPFWALQSQGLTGQPIQTRLEAMAATYLNQVLKVQPQGPLRLGGWSFGALVAFEMARQALASGRNVAQLFLLDMPLPPVGRILAEEQVRQRFTLEMERLHLQAGEDAGLELLYRVFEANLEAAARFQPVRLEVPALLVCAQEGLAGQDPRPGKGWLPWLPQLEIAELPGDHYSLLEPPQVEALATLLCP